jgi:hypothetical protein
MTTTPARCAAATRARQIEVRAEVSAPSIQCRCKPGAGLAVVNARDTAPRRPAGNSGDADGRQRRPTLASAAVTKPCTPGIEDRSPSSRHKTWRGLPAAAVLRHLPWYRTRSAWIRAVASIS